MSKESGGNKVKRFLDTIDNVGIVGGLGVAAVASVLAAPAGVVFGAAVAGGSIVGKEITNRVYEGYRKFSVRHGIGAAATRHASRGSQTLAA